MQLCIQCVFGMWEGKNRTFEDVALDSERFLKL